MNIEQPKGDGCFLERLGGGGPMMEFDPDSDVQDYFASLRRQREETPDERRG